jgi:hypothetical protein
VLSGVGAGRGAILVRLRDRSSALVGIRRCPLCSRYGRADLAGSARVGVVWVHLRACATCGQIRCCDSSPRHHASPYVPRASDRVVDRTGRGVGPVLPRRVRVGSRRLTRECRQLGPRVGWIVEMTADHAARQYDPADRDGGNSASGHEGQRGDHRDRAVPVDVPQGPCQQAGRSSRGSRRARWR